ncbi:unnamed protein product [Phytomonas sp. Hart1]|nr:unnamed protein product [Phytomonas sp. Hart1]|eukprot:CCW71087.1 unnamed protein product [Phytomonas sp. isolate Hart1]
MLFLVVDGLLLTQARFLIHHTLLVRTEMNEELLFFVSSLGELYLHKRARLQALRAPDGPRRPNEVKMEAEVGLLGCLYYRSITKLHRVMDYLEDVRDLEFLLEMHFLYEKEFHTMVGRERYRTYLTEKIKQHQTDRPQGSVNQAGSSYCPNRIVKRGNRAIVRDMDPGDDIQYVIDKLHLGKAARSRADVDFVDLDDRDYGIAEDLENTGAKKSRFSFFRRVFKQVTDMGHKTDSTNNQVASRSLSPKKILLFLLLCVIMYYFFCIP